ncbi:MAG: hypothetical protein DRP84_03215 [Spirochaetes bacterium]|nr:MAG: hypothetical protein DRP84_03215 [Spirochaetota bacterium]
MEKAKLSDVASKAGVSITTASNILNGKGSFSNGIKQKVFKAAKDLNYRKNLYASSIAKRKISHIGVLFHEDYEKAFEWNFIRHMLIQIEAVITKHNYYPVMIPVSLKLKAGEVLKKIAASSTGALFSIHYGNRELFTLLEDQDIPVVVINNSSYQDRFFSVCTDDFQGSYEGSIYLIDLGHQNIAFIDYFRPDQPTVVTDRFIGFKKAMDEHRINFDENSRITVNLNNMEELISKTKEIIYSKYRPTALFVHDDYLAARVIVALNELGFFVPEDISIIAPGDTLDYNQPFIPRITTMSIDTDMLGKLAGQMMIERLNGNLKNHQVLKVKQRLIKRGSCRKI